jgi:hypothetical protein
MNFSSHSLHSISSPGSSPTQSDFSAHPLHTLSRQQSFQHISYRPENGSCATNNTPLPPSPGGSVSLELYDDSGPGGGGPPEPVGRQQKRPRTSSISGGVGVGHSHGHPQVVGISLNGSAESVTEANVPVAVALVGSNAKKLSRARSDSAPLYGLGVGGWHGNTRPRSGSGMAPAQRMGGPSMAIPNLGSMMNRGGAPVLVIPPASANSPGRQG